LDKQALDGTFARKTPASPRLLPTEEFAAAYNSEPVEFTFQGETLRGYVYKADLPKGFIVFRHGITSQHADYLALICAMVDRGWTVFAYDAIGCGISDGDNVKGMAQSPLDVAAAVDFVRGSGMADGLPIMLWGHSWGGYGVAAALDIVPDVSGCVAMSGYNSPVGVLMEATERTMGPAAVTQYPTIWLINKLTFGADADRTALDGINKTAVPALIIHGTGDPVVAYDGSSIIAQRDKITNGNVQYLVMDEPGRNQHNSYFYASDANSYLSEKSAELEQLRGQYSEGLPEDVSASFVEGFDSQRANVADPELIDAIDAFFTGCL
jgi:alpha-beta hydrolase superfamily lysophospholipase